LLRLCTNRAGPARPSMYGCAPLWASCAAAAALVQLAAGCIVIELNPSGFHANVNNLLALIPLVAHLHNGTVHYRLNRFHYKCRLLLLLRSTNTGLSHLLLRSTACVVVVAACTAPQIPVCY